MKLPSLKQILIWLAVAFVIVSIWNDPQGTGSAAGPFLGDVGHFLTEAFRRIAQFFGGLAA